MATIKMILPISGTWTAMGMMPHIGDTAGINFTHPIFQQLK
jgi:hypothetical protein